MPSNNKDHRISVTFSQVQNQINRGKDDIPTFLRVLLVAFVRHENTIMALSRCSVLQANLNGF